MKYKLKRFAMASVAMLLTVLIYSCGSDPVPVRVFVGGEDILDTLNTGLSLPIIWENGKPMQLEGAGNDNTGKHVRDIAFVDGHLYAVGYETGTYRAAKVWMDGDLINTISAENSYFTGNSIAIANGDVYVALTKQDFTVYGQKAVLVKNNESTVLNDSDWGEALAVAVSGTDVYVGGAELSSSITETVVARLWKNGIQVELPNSENYKIVSIAVEGSNVYALGRCNCNDGAKIRYWKNGVMVDVTGSNETAFGNAIAVVSNTVYVAGYDYTNDLWRARVWKNNVGTTLPTEGETGYANDLVVKGSTVYAVGEQVENSFGYAMLWTNSKPKKLGTRRSSAYAVAIDKSVKP